MSYFFHLYEIFSIFQELKKNNVSTVVRVCDPSYKVDELESQGICVRDLPFEDGTSPPQLVIDDWFETLKQKYAVNLFVF